MNLKFLAIFLTIVTLTTASAPYCVYGTTKASFLSEYEDYTCQIDIDGQLDVFNEIWGPRDPDDPKKDSDVKILTVLERSKSLMTVFPSIFCEHYPNIEVIDMSDAEIKEVKLNSLKNCRNLEVARFYRNKLSKVDDNFLSSNRRLKEFYLNYNKFSTFSANLFRNQQDLQILDLSANILNELPGNIFSSLESLRTLKLDTNRLSNLNPDWFNNLENLQNLDLSGNGISELPENIFSTLQSLKTLNLDNNNLKTIFSHSFDQHPQLEAVSLNKNEIDAIDQRFIENHKIRILNMKGNSCSDESKITGSNIKRKLSHCFRNFKLNYEETTTTEIPTTTTTRRRKPTTTTPEPTTITTKRIITSTTTKPTTTTTTKRTTTRTTTPKRTTPKTTTTTTTPTPISGSRGFEIDDDECGQRPSGVPLIIKGNDFNHGSYPWMAVLVVDSKVHCGGVLISKAKVVTAGHCISTKTLREIDPKEITVVLGGHNLNLLHEVDRVAFGVRKVYVHENWNPYLNKFDSDIAVMMLREEVTYNSHIHPICIAFPKTPAAAATEGTIVGYGKTEDKSREFSNVPKQADAPIHDLTTCIRKFPQIQSIAHQTTFCGGHGNGTGACTGDSGGGLFVRIGKVFYLRGIVSASLSGADYGCSVEAYSLFTDITQFIPWIYKIGIDRRDDISLRMDGESPVSFVPPWVSTATPRTSFDGRPVWI